MAVKTLYKTINTNGEYSCGDIGVTTEEWLDLLNDEKSKPYHEALLCFLRQKEHKATCVKVSQVYGKPAEYYISKVYNFSKWVQKRLNRFSVKDADGKDTYWCITMQKGWDTKQGFQWQLRDELVEALRIYLMKTLIDILSKGKPFKGYYEEYKWDLLDRSEGKDVLAVFDGLRGENVIDNPRTDTVIKYLVDNKADKTRVCCQHLTDESVPLNERLAAFKSEIKALCPSKWKNTANDERTASGLLTCVYPETYTFYKDEIYQNICDYFGYTSRKAGKKYEHFMELVNGFVKSYGEEIQQIMLNEIKGFKNKPLNLAVQTLFWCMKDYMKEELKNKMTTDTNNSSKGVWYDDVVRIWERRKNMVLYGAPGTGKTYDVPELAVRLCDPSFMATDPSREEIVSRYNQLKTEKRIAFTTFHQSLDYEDWIEGLRPVVNENSQVTYEIESGIFKKLCEEAERPVVKDKQVGIADNAVVWKVSLAGTGDNSVRSDCMKNSYIRIGWDGYGPVISDETDWSVYNGEGKQILDAYINKMKIGDIVMSCYSSQTIDAIGVVVGDYEFEDKFPNYKRVRRVNWLVKNINENIVEMNDGKTMTLGTVYRLNSITLDNVKSILEKYNTSSKMEENDKAYVMVIDELNRGNVSKVFGELITLLEADKRKGRINAESVVLPYSKKGFHIPNNVYLIATMNTADRSLGSLDYAIRRRFAFIAEKPFGLEVDGFDEDLFEKVSSLFVKNFDEYKESGWDQTLKLESADTLSEEYKPEDVWIGHSYFLMQDEEGEDNTSNRLLYEIIPLLEEYVRDGVLTAEAQDVIDELYKQATE
ncbi:AAA family ATPase [Prevotella melaninogenica]|uniref:AAA family ATPase n=1 Tax=Prevotella melaninogenica TaxID=28132 RepID=UPI001C6050C9|nr:AAA family ATPase [Prevotella melaninogenica]MBW4729350.1 AAA family ATPase [Prevotella melaninogenica]MBW4731021.1 AAA family ATPase [Prevotella melaninogenica]MBW4749045.1 AAA family ATPase [Prevotella melaninogenica]